MVGFTLPVERIQSDDKEKLTQREHLLIQIYTVKEQFNAI